MHAITTSYDISMCLQVPNAHHSHSNGSHTCNITFEFFFYDLSFSKCNVNIGKKIKLMLIQGLYSGSY